MKAIINFMIMALCVAPLLAKAKLPSNNDTCLIIKGSVSKLNTGLSDGYQVELFEQNTVKDIIQVKNNKSFSFTLNKNNLYTIRISKEGFLTKIISINTKIDSTNKLIYSFEFETELISENRSKFLDKDWLEFPITIIEYFPETNWFYYNEEYTSNVKRGIFKLK